MTMIKNEAILKENLTEREATALDSLISLLYAEAGFSDVDANDICNDTGISKRSIGGVLGSLAKKGYVSMQDTDTYGEKIYTLIYLNEEYYYLHPKWSMQTKGVHY
jgi:transcription initiation factor IIE alpha subunit